MAQKRLNVLIFTMVFFPGLGLFLAVGDGSWNYVPAPVSLVVLCAVSGFASARLGDPGSYDGYSTLTSLISLGVGGLFGWRAASWSSHMASEGYVVNWAWTLPVVFLLTAAAGYFLGSLTPGLRPTNPSRMGRFGRVVPSGSIRAADMFIQHYAQGVPTDEDLLQQFRNPGYAVSRSNPDHWPLCTLRRADIGYTLATAHYKSVDRARGTYGDPTVTLEQVGSNDYLPVDRQFLVLQ